MKQSSVPVGCQQDPKKWSAGSSGPTVGTNRCRPAWMFLIVCCSAFFASHVRAIGATINVPVNPKHPVILDNTATDFTFTVSDTRKIQDVNLEVTLSHFNLADLSMFLTHPGFTQVTLFVQGSISGSNLSATVFDDEAGSPLSAGEGPYPGSFQPIGSLSSWDSLNANGIGFREA